MSAESKTTFEVSRSVTPHRSMALVLGATGGLGRAYCKALAARGFDLILSGRNTTALAALTDELKSLNGVAVDTLVADLCNPADCDRVVLAILNNSRLNCFVNAAGIAQWGAFLELPPMSEQDMFRVNLLAPIEFVRSAIDVFQTRGGGTIVHVASAAAFYSVPFLSSYCATKGAIVQLLTSVREEIKGRGVCVQALCPGFVKTEMFSRAGADADRLPRWIWMSPERVVRESLRAVDLNRAVCIPGLRYRLMLFGMKWVPAQVSRRVAGWLFGSFSKYRLTQSKIA